MIECSHCLEHIVEYIENLLPESEGIEVASHLNSCASCRVEESHFRAVHASIQSVVEQPTPLSSELKAKIMNSIECKPVSVQKPVWKSRWFLVLSPAFAFAVVAVVWFNANNGIVRDYNGSQSKMASGAPGASMPSSGAIPKNETPPASMSEESKAQSYAKSGPDFNRSKSVSRKMVDKKSESVSEMKGYPQSATGGKTIAVAPTKSNIFEMSVPSPTAALTKVEDVVRKLHIEEVSRTANPDTGSIELVLEISSVNRPEFMNAMNSISKTNGPKVPAESIRETTGDKKAVRSSNGMFQMKNKVSRAFFILRILKRPAYAP